MGRLAIGYLQIVGVLLKQRYQKNNFWKVLDFPKVEHLQLLS